jgi:hypothetical protein
LLFVSVLVGQTFQRCASYFKDRVEFMDVQCSRNEETTAFCSKSNVRAYPTLVLFTGAKIMPMCSSRFS